MASCHRWDGECYDEVRRDGVGAGVFGVERPCNKEGDEDAEPAAHVPWAIEGRHIADSVEGVVAFTGNIHCARKTIKTKTFSLVVIGEWI